MSSPSPADDGTPPREPDSPGSGDPTAIIVCGALTVDIKAIVDRRHWDVHLYPLPPLLHNRPDRIAAEVEDLIDALSPRYRRVAIGYADCGTYSALDEVCERRGVARLPGSHCYDVYAGADEIAAMNAEEPGTYYLTDFLVVGFDRIVWRSLGLDRHPELVEDYFRHYTRVVWLASRRTPDMEKAARRAAGRLGLPLETKEVAGNANGLEKALQALVERPVVVTSEGSSPATTGTSAEM